MRALLVLFLTSKLGFADKKAYAIYSVFAALGYTGPIIGGILADKLMGFRNMVVIGGIVIIIGHGLMALTGLFPDTVYYGLAFIAIGTGLFKGNITNLLGSCYEDNDPNRSHGFTIFYVSVNLGSFVSSLSCAFIANKYGWDYGFGLAGIGMILGLITFFKFQYILENNGASPRPDLMQARILGFSPIVMVVLASIVSGGLIAQVLVHSEAFANILAYCGCTALLYLGYIVLTLEREERFNIFILMILIIFLMIFFALEMQLGSLMNLFVDRNVDNQIFGIAIPSAASQAINPLSIMIFGFIFSTFIRLGAGQDIMRCLTALLCMSVAFFIAYFGCTKASPDGRVDYIYLLLNLSVIGLGEILIAPVIHSQVAKLAPKHLKGFIMGVLMLALAFSNLAGIVISEFMSVPSTGGEVNRLESLAIYQSGFLDVAKFNLYISVIFIPFGIYINKRLSKAS
jgi:POT family proton-dependent oligopeptide transporter